MIETFRKNITPDKFFIDGRNSIIERKSDITSYTEFLKYFTKLETITEHNLIIGINFTYGWMPTIFKFRSLNFKEAIIVLNRAKIGGDQLKIDELDLLKSIFNKSLVGTSKLLHFINPEKYAIWDSRVYRYLTNKENYNQIQNCNNYLDYLSFCNELIQNESFSSLKMNLEKKVGYTMTNYRIIELVMYLNGTKIHR